MSASCLSQAPGIVHAFFTREGGVSGGSFASLNCGFGSGDDRDRVARNRAIAAARIEVAAEVLLTVYQTHSAEAVRVQEAWTPDRAPRADAMATRAPGVALGILAADCAPVLLADAQARVIGAAHAGWRGARLGVIEAAVAAMVELGAERARIVAGIGPCIGPDSYEVGPEFRREFVADDAGNARFFGPGRRAGRLHFDLPGYVAHRLAAAGVATVEDLGADTLADEDRFFSYRRAVLRNEKDYGRALSAIALAR